MELFQNNNSNDKKKGPFSSSSSLSEDPLVLTQEELNLYYCIDRELFTRLLFTLGHEPGESVRLVGFLLWLERHFRNCYIVYTINRLPDTLVEKIYKEVTLCLKASEGDLNPVLHQKLQGIGVQDQLPTLRSLLVTTPSEMVTPLYFYNNRITVLQGVGKVVQDVCITAFMDIINSVFVLEERFSQLGIEQHPPPPPPSRHGSDHYPERTGGRDIASGYYDHRVQLFSGEKVDDSPSNAEGGHQYHHHGIAAQQPAHQGRDFSLSSYIYGSVGYGRCQYPHGGATSGGPGPNLFAEDEYDIRIDPSQLKSSEESFINSLVSMYEAGYELSEPTSPEERTLFLTFSRGYPIREDELRDYMTRKYNGIVESIPEIKPLHARVILREPFLPDYVLQGRKKLKFFINKKHVCARKFIPSKSGTSTDSSTSNSAAAAGTFSASTS